jgi:S-layer protein (TIGR01567 family)
VPLKYQVYAQANWTPGGTGGFYQAIGWLGEKHVYLQGNRLAKIIFEQNATEEKEMTIGESWELGEGYRVIANSISAKDTGGRQAWISLFKDSNKLVDTVMVQQYPNKFFSYQVNLSEGAPNFMIYYSRVDSLQYTDAAYFKYTWLRSQDIAEIREGDTFGVMEVISVKNGTIELKNKNPIDLAPGNTVHLMGDISIQVDSSKTGLLFYPLKGGI